MSCNNNCYRKCLTKFNYLFWTTVSLPTSQFVPRNPSSHPAGHAPSTLPQSEALKQLPHGLEHVNPQKPSSHSKIRIKKYWEFTTVNTDTLQTVDSNSKLYVNIYT